jgi:hypothetical protein
MADLELEPVSPDDDSLDKVLEEGDREEVEAEEGEVEAGEVTEVGIYFILGFHVCFCPIFLSDVFVNFLRCYIK